MRKLTVGLIVAAASSLVPQWSLAQEPSLFDKLDANKDGFVTADEAGGEDKKRIFEQMLRRGDKNGDGKLSKEEFTAGTTPKPDEPAKPEARPTDRPAGRPAGAPDLKDIFERFDKNGDGKLSKDEAPDRLRENFDRIDTDKDGFASKEELMRGFARAGGQPAPGEPARPAQGVVFGGPVLRALDANNDGQLSAEEIAGASKALATLDKNKDGVLSRDEIAPPGGATGLPAAGAGILERLKEADKNGDGKLSKEEAPAILKDRFDRIDANKDGQLDSEEIKSVLPRLLERRPDGAAARPEGAARRPANPEKRAEALKRRRAAEPRKP